MPRYRQTPFGLATYGERHPMQVEIARLRSSAAWQRAAKRQITRQPWCSDCGHEGSDANPLTADHVVPLAAGGAMWDSANHSTRGRVFNSAKGAL